MTRHLLLAVAGNTPATVTEAIHALAVQREIPLREVRVLTTRSAERALGETLERVLGAMRKDFPGRLDAMEAFIRAVDLDDIRTNAENNLVADWILAQVQEACEGPNTVVHASLAGGRKTMGFYLGAAMQLVARTEDRLYHVLVSPEYEVPGFYYPAPVGSELEYLTIRNFPTPSRHARVELAEVPFVSLRGLLPPRPTDSPPSFCELVARTRDALSPDFLAVHVDVRAGGAVRITYGSEGDAQAPQDEFPQADTFLCVFYTWLLRRQSAGKGAAAVTSPEEFPGLLADLQRWTEQIAPGGKVAASLRDHASNWAEKRPEHSKKNTERELLRELLYHEAKSWPSRHVRRLRKCFEEAPRSGLDPDKYALQVKDGTFSLRIPPERIHFHLPRKRAQRP